MIRLIATDFDGTIHHAQSVPCISVELTNWLRFLRDSGVKWAICSGRQLNEEFAAELRPLGDDPVPDFIVTVEREIQVRQNGWYEPDREWNARCSADHAELFGRTRPFLQDLARWLSKRRLREFYEDHWSPINLVAADLDEADAIHGHLLDVFRAEPDLTVVRNGIYFRLAHRRYNKGTALADIVRRLGLPRESVFAAGDHFNDLAMVDGASAGKVAAPANAIPEVKDAVARAGGYVARQPYSLGVLEALRHFDDADRRPLNP